MFGLLIVWLGWEPAKETKRDHLWSGCNLEDFDMNHRVIKCETKMRYIACGPLRTVGN